MICENIKEKSHLFQMMPSMYDNSNFLKDFVIMISVIIPLYNKEEAIEQCIQSILQQTYKDWELIIVDDGSTDSSSAKVKPFLKDSRIHYIYKENGGVSSARNRGIDLAQGEWSIYLDADDYLAPNALHSLITTANKYKVNIISGNFWIEKGNIRTRYCYGKERIVKENFRAWYFKTCCPRAGNTLFKTNLLKRHKFDENLVRYEDTKSLFDIIRTNKIAYIPEPVMVYSLNNLSLSKPTNETTKDFIFSIDFTNKPFWERINLANLINQGLHLYPKEKSFLRKKYAPFMPLIYIEHIFSYFLRTYYKLKKLL